MPLSECLDSFNTNNAIFRNVKIIFKRTLSFKEQNFVMGNRKSCYSMLFDTATCHVTTAIKESKYASRSLYMYNSLLS